MAQDRVIDESYETAAAVCTLFALEEKSAKLVESNPALGSGSPGSFLEALIREDCLIDALRFYAYALPAREAIDWACRCLRTLAVKADDAPCLDAASEWLKEPTEDNRRRAHTVAEQAEFGTAASWAAMAVFWSGGSIAPVDQPEVPAGPELVGHAVAGAVLLGAVSGEPQEASSHHQSFLAIAGKLDRGELRAGEGSEP